MITAQYSFDDGKTELEFTRDDNRYLFVGKSNDGKYDCYLSEDKLKSSFLSQST